MAEFKYFPTTIDNPNNPFVDWDAWQAFEIANGHCTTQLIDRFYFTSSRISESLDEFMWNLAIEDIMRLFPWYIRVTKDDEIIPIPIKMVEEMMKNSTNTGEGT